MTDAPKPINEQIEEVIKRAYVTGFQKGFEAGVAAATQTEQNITTKGWGSEKENA